MFSIKKKKYLFLFSTLFLLCIGIIVCSVSLTSAKYSYSAGTQVSATIKGDYTPGSGTQLPQEDPHIVTETPNTVYQVQSGDTLSKIAEKFNITIEALTAYNNIENTDNIQAGAILRIPPKDYVPPVSSEPSEKTDNTEKTENSSAEDSSEPSAALTGSDSSKEERSEKETIVENSDETSKTDTALTSETTENSAIKNNSEPSSLSESDTAKEEKSENETIIQNSDVSSVKDTAVTSKTMETSEKISTDVSADEEHIPVSDSNSDLQSEISRTPYNETE